MQVWLNMSHLSSHVAAVVLDISGHPEYELSGQLRVVALRKYIFCWFAVT